MTDPDDFDGLDDLDVHHVTFGGGPDDTELAPVTADDAAHPDHWDPIHGHVPGSEFESGWKPYNVAEDVALPDSLD